jgi:DNA polymerase
MSAPGAAAELEKLAEQVEACTRCDLHCNTHHGVPGEGPADAEVMLIGEGPGRNEDLQGRPFVGEAGKFLTELLAEAGLRREEVYITNVVKHRPTRQDPDGSLSNRAPLPEEDEACRVYLDRQIELIEPRLIVTLGAHSLGAFFPGQSIMRTHGSMRQIEGRYFYHSFHPAAALYKRELRDTMLQDMKRLGELLRTRVRRTETLIAAQPDPDSSIEEEPEQLTLF